MKIVGKLVPTVASAICFGLMGCDQSSTSNSDSGSDSLLEGSESVVAVPGSASENYKTIADQIDAGGVFYGIMDVEGDIDQITEMLKGIYGMVAPMSGGELPELDIEAIVRDLGLYGIEGIGMSSVKDGSNQFLNKSFLLTPEGRQGVLRAMGNDAGALKGPKFAPSDTDVLIEQEFQLKAITDVLRSISNRIDINGEKPLEQFLDMPVPNFSMTVSDLVSQLNGRLLVAATLVEGETLVLPDMPTETEIPAIDLVICLEELGWLFEKLQEMFPPEAELPLAREETDAFVKYTMEQIPVPDPSFARYKPVVYFEKASKRIFIATHQAYLDRCLASDNKIEGNTAFKAMFKDLPTEGNAMFYMSSRVQTAVESIMQTMMASAGEMEEAMTSQMMSLFTGQMGAMASVSANLPNGFYSVTRAPQSHKATLIQMMLINPMTMAAVSSMSMQRQMMMMNGGMQDTNPFGVDMDGDMMQLQQMQQVVTSLQMYAIDNQGNFPDELGLLTPDYLDPQISGDLLNWPTKDGVPTPLLYFPGHTSSSVDTMVVAAPDSNFANQRVIGMSDGTVQLIDDQEFLGRAQQSMETDSADEDAVE